MSRPNYRVVLSFDSERKVFVARIPELSHCSAEGATRGEAITRLEEELDALLHNLSESGSRPPRALDDAEAEPKLTGELQLKVSVGLQRELTWQAHAEGVPLAQLCSELLAGALEHRRQSTQGSRGPRRHGGNDNIGNSIGNEAPRGRFQGGDFAERDRQRAGNAARFHDMLEDRAAFVDYVRRLESDGARPRDDRGRTYGDGRSRGMGDGRPHADRDHRAQGDHRGHGGDRGGPGRRHGRDGHRPHSPGEQRQGDAGGAPPKSPGPAEGQGEGRGKGESES